MNKLEQIKKKIFMSMKIMDTSIKGVNKPIIKACEMPCPFLRLS